MSDDNKVLDLIEVLRDISGGLTGIQYGQGRSAEGSLLDLTIVIRDKLESIEATIRTLADAVFEVASQVGSLSTDRTPR